MKTMTFFTNAAMISAVVLLLISCGAGKNNFDASGNFEADEVIMSAQQNGELLTYAVNEGDRLNEGQVVGQIDVSQANLQKEQVQATISSLQQKTVSPQEQIDVVQKQLATQQSQLNYLQHERQRTENLVKGDAAPRKQLDDVNAQIDQLQKQMAATRQQIGVLQSNAATQNRSVLSEKAPLEKKVAQLQEQISKGQIVNPVKGTVLTNYAMEGEVAAMGKPLYKIANTDTIFLRAYVTGVQLPQIRLGQAVKVLVDSGAKDYRNYNGVITWISDKAEFTPKTIQTKEERANLVYAIRIRVANDGLLKIGMYGEVVFGENQ